ncbi:cytochrome P450 2G1-like [Pelodytes ibericus]
MDVTWIGSMLLVLVISLFFYTVWNSIYRYQNLPPGPTPLPLIGNLLQIERGRLTHSFMKYWEQYGSIYTLYFGPNPVIVLCGYDMVKAALVDEGEVFGARGSFPTMTKFTHGYGVGFSNGERWRQMRSFTFRTLKSFGFGKKNFESKIQEEVKYVQEELQKMKGEPLDPTRLFMAAFSNILFSIIFGDRCDYKDDNFLRLLAAVEEIFDVISSPWGQLHSILPQLMDYIPGPHQSVPAISKGIVSFIEKSVRFNQKTLNLDVPRHFIDTYLIKMEKEKDNPDTEFTMRNLVVTTHNLFIAGTETVSSTLRHALLILLKYPEIQAKVREEIDRVISRDRNPEVDDRMDMPYTDAVLHEVHRFCDIAPFNVPHMVTKTIEFKGYIIPKGTDVYPLLCTVHCDPKYFSTPYKFNPNHFLDENGRFKKNEAMMAFSAGKRVCPGEGLARMEFFIFLTSILQNFTLSSETEFTESDIAPKLAGFLNTPIHYQLSFIPR